MGAALTIFVLLSFSVFVVRIASVALRLTGMVDSSARFQALSAFTGTGFTTAEAETIVNYPVRRRIVSLLMIIGNMGLVTVFATVVVSLVNTEGAAVAVVIQVVWLIAGIIALWFLMLNKRADQILCRLIGQFLKSTTFLGQRNYERIVQLGDGYSVCEHPIRKLRLIDEPALDHARFDELGLQLLAVRKSSGIDAAEHFTTIREPEIGDALVLYGRDAGHDSLEGLIHLTNPRQA
jgi:hypothetical protein